MGKKRLEQIKQKYSEHTINLNPHNWHKSPKHNWKIAKNSNNR
jgi:hypothetical protein